MKIRICLLVFIGVLSVVLCGETPVSVGPEPPNTPSTKPTEPTTKPTSKPPTPEPTTKPTSKPPTPEPTTKPTSKPPTPEPTTKPTSKPPTPEPTTKPTSKPPAPEPTTKPTPEPPMPPPQPPQPTTPTAGTWGVKIAENVTCLLLHAAIQLEIPYITNNGTLHSYVNIPPYATSTGSCKENGQISLTWNETAKVSFDFGKTANTSKYSLTNIDIVIKQDAHYFPGAKDNSSSIHLYHTRDEFETSVTKSYKCVKEQKLNLTEDSTKDIGVLRISDFRFEAFQNSTNNEFTNVEDCAPFDTPDIVPIAVGCALAALVLIVLAAYLIGRRRRQARGYLSM